MYKFKCSRFRPPYKSWSSGSKIKKNNVNYIKISIHLDIYIHMYVHTYKSTEIVLFYDITY